MEFYSLVSRELQRANLELWSITGGGRTPDNIYMFSSCGLFPSPLGRSTKVSQLVKVKSKFRFIGKLMAKAVMDSRLVSRDVYLLIDSDILKVFFSSFNYDVKNGRSTPPISKCSMKYRFFKISFN